MVFTPVDVTREIVLGRQSLSDALEDRLIALAPAQVICMYSFAALLDPRFKNFRFLSNEESDTAVNHVRQERTLKWKPKAAMANQPKPAAQKDARKDLTSLLATEVHGSVAPPDRNNDSPRDQLADYVSLPVAAMQTCGIDYTVIPFPT